MLSVIQRVKSASVRVNQKVIGEIGQGILALVAVEKDDTTKQADRLLQRILNYRIFADDQGKMNLSLLDINGSLLLVPQFTLAADTDKGNRPSFSTAATPELGLAIFTYMQELARTTCGNVKSGQFGANMQVSLQNDGPVTFILRVS